MFDEESEVSADLFQYMKEYITETLSKNLSSEEMGEMKESLETHGFDVSSLLLSKHFGMFKVLHGIRRYKNQPKMLADESQTIENILDEIDSMFEQGVLQTKNMTG